MRAALGAALLLAACRAVPIKMRVLVEPPAYVVWMSSAVGLGLTPVADAPSGMKIRYAWRADAGYFLTQSATDGKLSRLGREIVTEGGKLLWSYDPDDQSELETRPVKIAVAAENARNGREVARTDLTLAWDGQFFRPAP